MNFSTFVKKMNKAVKSANTSKTAKTKKVTKPSQGTKNASKSTASRNNAYEKEMKRIQEELDYQHKLLTCVNMAQAQYRKDNDLDKVIAELEYAFVESNPPCKSTQAFDLIKYYTKAGMNDKAWSYLNKMYIENEKENKHTLNDRIRFEQAKIHKKEKNWVDAIEKYMLGYLIKCSDVFIDFREDKFLKDISSSANKLKLDDKARNDLVNILKQRIDNRNFSESELSKEFRKYFESFSVL